MRAFSSANRFRSARADAMRPACEHDPRDDEQVDGEDDDHFDRHRLRPAGPER